MRTITSMSPIAVERLSGCRAHDKENSVRNADWGQHGSGAPASSFSFYAQRLRPTHAMNLRQADTPNPEHRTPTRPSHPRVVHLISR